MAENNGDSNGEKNYFRNTKKNLSGLDDSESDSDGTNPKPDIGLGVVNSRRRNLRRETVMECSSAAASSDFTVRREREENPFSFKHFLNRDSTSSQLVGGARPKVFSQPTAPAPSSSTSSPVSTPRLMSNPELTSGLPDFVQDHLVIEQCYLQNAGQGPPCQLAVDLDNLPDFAPVNVPSNDQWNSSRHQGDLPFDLTSNRRERVNETPSGPLDLPESLPFDLPSASGEVGASKSLPDFLSDGPIHSERRNDTSQPASDTNSPSALPSNGMQSPRLQMENDRLRRELDSVRRQLSEQVRRNEMLELDLAALRSKEFEDTAGLEKVIEQVEDNLKRTRKRAATAENKVTVMKQEIRLLTSEIEQLRGQGAAAGTSGCCDSTNSERLAYELKAAASTAEVSLRQLLSGVDNLRLIASTLENKHNIEEDPPDFLDPDTLDESGPAL